MKFQRVIPYVFVASICSATLIGQQSTDLAAIQRNPQALALLEQVRDASGGPIPLGAVQDFVATGTIDYPGLADKATRNATVRARGMNQLRIDESTSESSHSFTNDNGNAWLKGTDGNPRSVRRHDNVQATSTILPLLQLVEALRDPTISVVDLGVDTNQGQQEHGIRLQRHFSAKNDPAHILSDWSRQDFFVDPATLRIMRLHNQIHPTSITNRASERDVVYGDYRLINGVLVPFQITEMVMSRTIFVLQFTNFQFNAGASDTDFANPSL